MPDSCINKKICCLYLELAYALGSSANLIFTTTNIVFLLDFFLDLFKEKGTISGLDQLISFDNFLSVCNKMHSSAAMNTSSALQQGNGLPLEVPYNTKLLWIG